MGRRRYSGHYGRKSPRKIDGERERAIFPMELCEYRDWSYAYPPCNTYKLQTDRDFAPYENGDVILVRENATTVKVARVIGVKAEPRYERHKTEGRREIDCYLPRFKVQFLTKDGYWSALWQYVWPGDIYRAYYDSITDQPVFRPTFLLPAFVEALT